MENMQPRILEIAGKLCGESDIKYFLDNQS